MTYHQQSTFKSTHWKLYSNCSLMSLHLFSQPSRTCPSILALHICKRFGAAALAIDYPTLKYCFRKRVVGAGINPASGSLWKHKKLKVILDFDNFLAICPNIFLELANIFLESSWYHYVSEPRNNLCTHQNCGIFRIQWEW